MSIKNITSPSTDEHFARIEAVVGTLVVSIGETIVCTTSNAIQLFETSPRGKYPPVLYFPKVDVSDDLEPVPGRSTRCPLKGDASYYSFQGQEVAWIYDQPLPNAALLRDYVGFYSDKVTIRKA